MYTRRTRIQTRKLDSSYRVQLAFECVFVECSYVAFRNMHKDFADRGPSQEVRMALSVCLVYDGPI